MTNSFINSPTVPTLRDAWGATVEDREQAREDIRLILNVATTLDGLGTLTEHMNRTADISARSVTTVLSLLAEHKALEAKQIAAQSELEWDGSSAPLRKADVVEYDTEIFHKGGSVSEMKTAGVVRRMGEVESQIRFALDMNHQTPYARMFRS